MWRSLSPVVISAELDATSRVLVRDIYIFSLVSVTKLNQRHLHLSATELFVANWMIAKYGTSPKVLSEVRIGLAFSCYRCVIEPFHMLFCVLFESNVFLD